MSNEELVKLIQEGDRSYLETLYTQNKPFLESLARKYVTCDDFEDLCQEAFLGLEQAAQHYDPSKGKAFISYAAYWMTQFIWRYKQATTGNMKIPAFMYDRIKEYKRVISDYVKQHGTEPDPDYMIQALGISELQLADVMNVISILSSSKSIDDIISDEDGLTVGDTIPDPDNGIDELLDDIEREELRTVLWSIVDKLHGKEPEVIRKRYKEGKTLAQCGTEMCINPERVRQIEASGIRRIKDVHYRKLLQFVDHIIESEALKCSGLSKFRYSFTSCVEASAMKIEARLKRVKH